MRRDCPCAAGPCSGLAGWPCMCRSPFCGSCGWRPSLCGVLSCRSPPCGSCLLRSSLGFSWFGRSPGLTCSCCLGCSCRSCCAAFGRSSLCSSCATAVNAATNRNEVQIPPTIANLFITEPRFQPDFATRAYFGPLARCDRKPDAAIEPAVAGNEAHRLLSLSLVLKYRGNTPTLSVPSESCEGFP